MLIASQFLLWVAAALLFIAVVALSRQVSGLRERLDHDALCTRCGQTHEAAADSTPRRRSSEPNSFA